MGTKNRVENDHQKTSTNRRTVRPMYLALPYTIVNNRFTSHDINVDVDFKAITLEPPFLFDNRINSKSVFLPFNRHRKMLLSRSMAIGIVKDL